MGRIKEEDIDALRDRADVVEVISGYTTLKRSGGQTYKGLCPFHSEKTPSFSVNAANGLFICFGCQESGNIYQFIQKIENLPFPEAVEWLARKTGFELRYEEMRPGEARAAGQKARLIQANEAAARLFHQTLVSAPSAAAARRYLGGRGFTRDVCERWQLGFAPGGDALCRHLLSKGFSTQEIVDADLGRESERDGRLYDSFRSRITFPTWSLQGDVVGFGARALGDQQPKYLNTSETPVFSKSRVMYGLNRAKAAIARGSAVVVEGYTDVISLHEAGITEAVATNGVALAESHFELLRKFSRRIVLMFDPDEAGKGATERGFGMFHSLGVEVLVAPLPAGRDPADLAGEDGADGVRKVIDAARPILEFKLDQTIAKLPLDTPEARARAVREAAAVLGSHPDPIARGQYVFMAADRIGVDPEAIERALAEQRAPVTEGMSGGGHRERDRRLPGHVKVEQEALQLLLRRRSEASRFLDGIGDEHFTSAPRRELFRKAVAALAPDATSSEAELAEQLSPEARSLFAELTVEDHGEGIADEQRIEEVFVRLKTFRLEREIRARRNTLQDVNPLTDARRHDELFTELVGLEARRRDLLRKLEGAA